MLNPILKKNGLTALYISIWLIISCVHTLWLFHSFELNLKLAIIESLVFNTLYAIIGLLIWYSLFFIKGKDTSSLTLIVNHLALAIFVTLIWLHGGKAILELIFSKQEEYLAFLHKTYFTRLISGFFYFTSIAFGYYLIDFSTELEEKIRNEVVLKEAVRDAELKALKSQINPHFLFNSLNSISYLTLTEGEKAHSMIVKLSDYLRYSISSSQNKKVKLSEEIKNINRYLEIEKIRFGKRLNYAIKSEDACQTLLLPNMILQPLYENAIKYGVHESLEGITIKTVCKKEKDFLFIEISNNFDEESYTTKKGVGVGLDNIKKRLALIYKSTKLLKVQKEQNIFTVQLFIPQKQL